MKGRPPLLFERVRTEALNLLEYAMHADLTSMRRCDVTLLRADLGVCKRLQSAFGQFAPWEAWRSAFARVRAELDRRGVA